MKTGGDIGGKKLLTMERICAKLLARCRGGTRRALITPREQQAQAVCCVAGRDKLTEQLNLQYNVFPVLLFRIFGISTMLAKQAEKWCLRGLGRLTNRSADAILQIRKRQAASRMGCRGLSADRKYGTVAGWKCLYDARSLKIEYDV